MDLLEKAIDLSRKEKFGEAIAAYQKAISEDPDDERPYCGAILLLMTTKRLDEAGACIERLMRRHPEAAYPHGAMGSLMEMRGRPAEALPFYEKMIEMDPGEAFARLHKAQIMLKMGDKKKYKECVAELKKAEPPSDSAAEDKKKALDALEKKYDGDPTDLMPSMKAMADVLLYGPGGREELQPLFELARSMEKGDGIKAVKSALDDMFLGLDPGEGGPADEKIGEANALIMRGEGKKAVPLYEEAVKLDQDDARGYCGMIITLMMIDRQKEAEGWAEKLVRIRPDDAYPHGIMGSLMEISGRPDEALACYDKMIEIDPGEMAARLKKALILFAGDRDDEAQKCLEEALVAEPSSDSGEDVQDLIADLLDDDDEMEEDEIAANPEVAIPGMEEMVTVLTMGEDFDEDDEDEDFDDEDDEDDEDEDFDDEDEEDDLAFEVEQLVYHANKLADGGRFAEAVALLDDALQLDPDFADAHSIRAMMMVQLKRYREAVECVDEVLRLRPDDVEDLGVKGMLFEKMGRPEEAMACYDRIIEVEPGEIMAYYLKCGMLAEGGEAGELEECYRAAMAAEPSDRDGARMKKSMRGEYRELKRCVARDGPERGLEKFMAKTGVAAKPKWGRAGDGP